MILTAIGFVIAIAGAFIVNRATDPPTAYFGMSVFIAGGAIAVVSGAVWLYGTL